MNSYFSVIFVLVLAIGGIATVQAADVRLDGTELVVDGVDDSLGLGAVDIVLQYGSDVSVTSVTALPGFMTVENIKNDDGMTIIAAISTEGKTGDVPVATVLTEGNGTVTISVRELANGMGDPIPYSNPTFTGTIPPGGSDAPVETTTHPTSAPSSSGSSDNGGKTVSPVTAETSVIPEETTAAAATGTSGSVPQSTETAVVTSLAETPTASSQQPESNATPLSPFVLVLALGLGCTTYRMINKSGL